MALRDSVTVIGLGYVGLPLAVALATKRPTWGLDIDETRIAELREGRDRTGEIDGDRLAASSLQLASDPAQCPASDFYIVTVPTPVDSDNKPDLTLVLKATQTVAGMIDPARKPVIIYESTVYPGVTEDLCGPELERLTGLRCGTDFFLGYSPERINPGDREHTVDRITKVVSGQTPEILDEVADLYGEITSGGVFRAQSIKTAEAAKVIENAQRDINIAFMNEIAQIFERIGISVWDVLDAAGTKWNFLPFQPGLVGGHCISVDPYYLSHRAEELGLKPQIILAGRTINDGMARWVAERIQDRLGVGRTGTALVLGLTFKEDVPDLRNSKVIGIIERLAELGHQVTVHDPIADEAEALHEYGVTLERDALDKSYDLVVAAVPHQAYRALAPDQLRRLVAPDGLLADLKRTFVPAKVAAEGIELWTL